MTAFAREPKRWQCIRCARRWRYQDVMSGRCRCGGIVMLKAKMTQPIRRHA